MRLGVFVAIATSPLPGTAQVPPTPPAPQIQDVQGIVQAGTQCYVPAGSQDGPMSTVPGADYSVADTNEWTTQYLRLAVLRQVAAVRSVDHVLGDANRSGTKLSSTSRVGCFHTGFRMDDDATVCWRPQGLTGSADAFPASSGATPGGRKALAISWHDDGSPDSSTDGCQWADGKRRGSRVSFVDVTDMNAIRYHHVLLVEPCEAGGVTTVCPVDNHAGGIAWVGKYLYMVDTDKGFRVFDTEQILQANNSDAAAETRLGVFGGKLYAFNYKYVLPQVGRYQVSGCPQIFSWVSADRSTSPASLLSGEYSSSAGRRLFRWPLASNGRLQAASDRKVVATEVRVMGQKRVQGGLSRRVGSVTKFFLVGKPDGGESTLYRKSAGGVEQKFAWSGGASQNLHYSPFSDNLWGLDEFNGRPVWACKLSALD
jgi:hypothetical protein